MNGLGECIGENILVAGDGVATKVVNVVKNKPSELLFFVPEALKTGSFQVEVRAAKMNRKNIKAGRLLIDLVPVS